MQKAFAGVRGVVTRVRPDRSDRSFPTSRATRLQRRSVGSARRFMERLAALTRAGFASERVLPVGVAVLVLAASMASFQPAAATGAAIESSGPDVRIAVGGVSGTGVIDGATYDQVEMEAVLGRTSSSGGARGVGPDVDDGTLWKPVLVDTSVIDGKSLLRKYTVKAGDTLTGIASEAGVSMMTLWWANKLSSKDDLHVGQSLVIPPVDGLVVTVKDGDTLDTLSAAYKVDPASVVDVNGLVDTNLVIGQVLILPGASGAPIPVPPAQKHCTTCGGGTVTYTGGRFAWPVVGGHNYISQYFHYGHYALDIAAAYGSKVVAAAAGTIVFAGWRNNGGGYQVWIFHGNNLYTGYFHMSSLTVVRGQRVARGQQVGRIGMTGWATGPHLHFVVSIGPLEGGRPVNPLRYY